MKKKQTIINGKLGVDNPVVFAIVAMCINVGKK